MGLPWVDASPYHDVVESFGSRSLPLLRKSINSGYGLFEDLQHDIAPVSGYELAQGLTVASFAHIICAEQVWRPCRWPKAAIKKVTFINISNSLRGRSPSLFDGALKTEGKGETMPP
jgi:hypothetical protein